MAVGADGTLIVADCAAGGGAVVRGLDARLQVTWSVDIGVGCPSQRSAALGSDGVLYIAHNIGSDEAEIVAIQTTSPGAAKTSFAVVGNGDSGNRGWIGGP
jgi:hypothetical protein